MFKLQHTHCSECGAPFSQHTFPKKCDACAKIKWDNPIPVAVLLHPIYERALFTKREGLAMAYRGIEPCKGSLALIGGFMDSTDLSAEAAAHREFREETGLRPKAFPKVWFSESNFLGNLLFFCVVDKPMHVSEWLTGTPCAETESLAVIWEDDWDDRIDEIAFPLHRQAVAKWFRGLD